MIGGELPFMPFCIPKQRRGHHTGAEDQEVEGFAFGKKSIGEAADRGRVEQVHGNDLYAGNV